MKRKKMRNPSFSGETGEENVTEWGKNCTNVW